MRLTPTKARRLAKYIRATDQEVRSTWLTMFWGLREGRH